MRVLTHNCAAIVFDLDGVLVDSSSAVVAAWEAWRKKERIPWKAIKDSYFGRRTQDVIADLAPHLDSLVETAFVRNQESAFRDGVKLIPGAAELIARLPPERWGIATSGDSEIARDRLAHVGLPVPAVFVTAESVSHGKPHPEPYALACAELAAEPGRCVVFEDAPDGVLAAENAGCFPIGVATWMAADGLRAPVVVRDLLDVEVLQTAPHLTLRFISLI